MRFFLGALSVVTAVATPLVKSVTIGPVTIELEHTTLASAARRLGNADLARAGDAGGSRVQACYVTPGHAPTTFYLESGEMGGGDRILQVDVVGPGSTTASTSPVIATRCSTLAITSTKAGTNTGVTLGLPRAVVERRLHVRGRDSVGVTLYEKLETSRAGTAAYDVSSWVRVRYVNGVVASLSVGKITSS